MAERAKAYYDRTAHPLRPLAVGQRAAIQNRAHRWVEEGIIVEKNADRSYFVKLPSGRVKRRNRSQLRPIKHPQEDDVLLQTKMAENKEERKEAISATKTGAADKTQQDNQTSERPKRNIRKPLRFRE